MVLNILALTSADDGVCLGRDIVPVRTEPNGGTTCVCVCVHRCLLVCMQTCV